MAQNAHVCRSNKIISDISKHDALQKKKQAYGHLKVFIA